MLVTQDKHALIQLIGYVGIPSLDVLFVVFGAHKNGALLPYGTWYHPTAHCKLHTLSVTGLITMTLDAVVDPPLAAVMSVWLPIFTASQESTTGPALFDWRFCVNSRTKEKIHYMHVIKWANTTSNNCSTHRRKTRQHDQILIHLLCAHKQPRLALPLQTGSLLESACPATVLKNHL